jgi:hypothetical protein
MPLSNLRLGLVLYGIDGLANALAITKNGNDDRHALHTGRNRIAALA